MTRLTDVPGTTDTTVALSSGTIAVRAAGPSAEPPLVLLQRFRGTMDDWDPAFIEALAKHRRVISFDSAGVGRSGGSTPITIAGMADVAAEVIAAVGPDAVDVLGWSMGGCVGLDLSLRYPELVRRLISAASSPGGVPEGPSVDGKVWQVAGKAVNDEEDFLYLFFADSPTSQAAGRANLERLHRTPPAARSIVGAEAVQAQFSAIGAWSAGKAAARPQLAELRQPVLVANGVADRMVPAYNSYVLATEALNAKLVLYPDAGHGFLFQHHAAFADEVQRFLADEPDPRPT